MKATPAPQDPRRPRAVVELAAGFGPGMLAAKLLADLGHAVYKIESPAGDPLRAQAAARGETTTLFDLMCGSKSSVRIDLAAAQAHAALAPLLAHADVVVADLAGWTTLQRLFGAAGFKARFAHLTCAVCTPFGLGHAWSGWKAGEEGLQALTGIMSTTGHPGQPPTRVSGAIVTHAAAMYAVTSVLADLRGKAAGGQGATLDLAMFDAAISLLTAALPAYFLSGTSPRGLGNRHSMAAPWNTFRCSDGWVVICAGNEPTWQRLVAVLGRPDLATNPDYATQEARVRNVDRLDAEVDVWTRVRSTAEVEAALDAQGVPSGPILPLDEVLRHPQFAARGLIRRDALGAIAGGVFHRNGAPLPVRRGHAALGAGTAPLFLDVLGIRPEVYDDWRMHGLLAEQDEVRHAAAA
ncbi:MAG: acyl-CoA transferase [Rhodoferax sp.]|nr:acyl-CoA transferase [Rhodoferax sp.]